MIHPSDRQTDKQTDRQTQTDRQREGQAIAYMRYSIYAVAHKNVRTYDSRQTVT